MNNSLSWDQIRFFLEVTKAGSVVKAAQTLGVSHATVLRNISRLERDLSTKLFDRFQSGYRITARGEEILPSALAMQEQAEALVRQAAAKNPMPEGLLRLLVPDSSLFNLMPSLAEFHTQYPLISVSTDQLATESMVRSKADVAIVVTNTPPDQLVGRQLAKLEFAYYASDTYLGSLPNQPSEYDWITWGSADTSDIALGADWQEKELRRFSKQPKIAVRASRHSDALSAIRAGTGVGFLKKPQEGLTEVPLKSNINFFGLWLLTHQDLQRSGRVRAFMDFAVEYFNEPQA
ncbi:MAG: DNA-binding transcriptional LysR family regulator [Limisphaerales bacterium]|jgi:DNA-binding transcriptional LysR family regulator